MRILRHPIDITPYQRLDAPAGRLLSVAVSRTNNEAFIDLWSIDVEDGVDDTYGIYIAGTGHPLPANLARTLSPPRALVDPFIGTVVTPAGFVWHVFEGPVRASSFGDPSREPGEAALAPTPAGHGVTSCSS